MFDNLKRVSKRLEDTEGSILDTIQYDFLLPRELAKYDTNPLII